MRIPNPPMAPTAQVDMASMPLCVDLDGTLIRTDLLLESFVAVMAARPWLLLLVPLWLLRGKAFLKSRLADRFELHPALLPYDQRVLDYVAAQKAQGRTVALVTAANQRLARQVADHLGLFDIVMASDARHNLGGRNKAAALVERFGAFEYIGNGRTDLAVWRNAARVTVANPSRGLRPGTLRRHLSRAPDLLFPRPDRAWKGLAKALRPHQWSKNLLVFVPIITANQLGNLPAWGHAALAFASFCATASAIYIINDLTDLAADRAHPRKRRRPFASGAIPLSLPVLALGPVLLILGLAGAAISGVALALGLYAAASLTYSLWLKKLPLVDVFTLAFLYVSRMIVGGLATGFVLSLWLLGFSAFLFLALAMVKRVAELQATEAKGSVKRRGYHTQDAPMLTTMGVASSFAASVLLTLYVQSDEVAARYSAPYVLWLLVPLILFWQLRLWLSTSRGYMHDDPIVYSGRDWVSWLVSACAVVLMAVAGHVSPFHLGPLWGG
ncbi:UbiA family prenyltransferase [Rhodopila sp.]|uniref:UbiA family prenyltransferase n=1 Tax=Rhodopila sp. TaxID=2480087 RepID=UPI002D80A64D|nr:UbiA family prenyltransferase [Rhodopila sp.]